MADQHFDIIIIGGRPAGASLAARLAQNNMRVLVVDRATFPSKPAVPSCPLVLPHTMALLDEIGVPESAVAASGAKLNRFVLEMNGHFEAEIDFDWAMQGDPRRHYFYSIRRDPFDLALWENLQRFPSVTARQNFAVTALLRDADGRVTGIEGQTEGGGKERFTSDAVIGADGRFSFVAREVNAAPFNEHTEHLSDFYFAYWRGGRYDHPQQMSTMRVYSNTRGMQFLIFPVGADEAAISVQMIPDLVRKEANESIEDYYEARLRSYPTLWKQLQSAERVSQVWGMKKVGNGYREVGGAGWALVGDAAHYKDSIDAQGIYDALSGAKLLAKSLVDWKAGRLSWDAAVQQYRADLLAETYEMFLQTQARLKREIHDMPPDFVIRNIIRRVSSDPIYQKKFIAYVTRRIDPKGWLSPDLMLGALVRGIGRDLRASLSPQKA